MQILATRIAQEIPPKYPSTFEYIPLFFAHSLMHLRVKVKLGMLGTRSRIKLLTLQPLRDLIVYSSQFLRMLSSSKF